MSAETGKKEIANLSLLFAQALTLIDKGKRDGSMTETLMRALQLFKENTLGKIERRQVLTPSELQALFSREVRSLQNLPPAAENEIEVFGMKYIGELAYFILKSDSGFGEGAYVGNQSVHDLVLSELLAIGIPIAVDVRKVWSPPYWADERRDMFSVTNCDLFCGEVTLTGCNGTEYRKKRHCMFCSKAYDMFSTSECSEYLGELWGKCVHGKTQERSALRSMLVPRVADNPTYMRFHACMTAFPPPDWKAPV